MPTVYVCENSACPLGSREDPGRFTGGATYEYLTTVLGISEPQDHGEGVCPSCGTKGTPDGEIEFAVGSDPYDDLHQVVAQKIDDESDPTNRENAQEVLHALVEEREGEAVVPTTSDAGGEQ